MTFFSRNIKQSKGIYGSIVRLNLSARLISHDTVFFSHNKTASAVLSAAKIIYRTAHI
jgi:hypothetical protein